ncbi:MAG: PEGA domain-containing protein [Deltaproteobacteria bacterium]|nr:PEGA domain-containing protein [Deltaproteobacteria bacterium]
MRAAPLCIALTAAALARSPSVHAQDHEPLLRQGVELRRRGDDAAALQAFSAAYAARPEARTAAQLGAVHQALGHWRDAERFLREALAAVGDPWITRNRVALEASSAEVSRHLGTLDLQGEPPGAEVLIDGHPMGRLPLAGPLRVVAGVLTVTLRAEGHSSAVHRVVVEPGTFARETFDPLSPEPVAPVAPVVAPTPATLLLGPATPVSPPAVPPAQVVFRPVSRRDPVPLVFASLSGAALSLGLAAIVAREGTASTFNTTCPSAGAVSCDGLTSQFDAWGVVAAVAIPVGILAAGVCVWRVLSR